MAMQRLEGGALFGALIPLCTGGFEAGKKPRLTTTTGCALVGILRPFPYWICALKVNMVDVRVFNGGLNLQISQAPWTLGKFFSGYARFLLLVCKGIQL